MAITPDRRVENDWYDGVVPDNAILDPRAYLETSYSFEFFRSRQPAGLQMDAGAAAFTGTMFDLGCGGRIHIGRCSMLNVCWLICDELIDIGDHVLISWNAVLMDNYRQSTDPLVRRKQLERFWQDRCEPDEISTPRPIRIGNAAWIGFDSVILPGVSIGEGSIIGCRSVVAEDVPPFSIAAGNPARIIRNIEPGRPTV